MKNEHEHLSFMQYISNIKASLASSISITVFSFSHTDSDWYVIDSWTEVGVIVGIILSIANFVVYVYDKFKTTHRK